MTTPISAPLEDYLETIYLLVQEHGFARVKDIARTRKVKAATVSIALRRLAESGFVDYERREYIRLTASGEEVARRVFARHCVLSRFFEQVLKMAPDAASEQACAMEHSLTDEAMDRMVRFFEFLGHCPAVSDLFRSCPAGVSGQAADAPGERLERCAQCACTQGTALGPLRPGESTTIADLKPGQRATVLQIATVGEPRQRLLDMGILPDASIDMERAGSRGDPVWIRCQGAQLALRRSEARAVRVRKEVSS